MTHEEQAETAESVKKLTTRVDGLEKELSTLRTHVTALAHTRPAVDPAAPPAAAVTPGASKTS